jgi:hypothetical protein
MAAASSAFDVQIETRDGAHTTEIIAALTAAGFQAHRI